ncbi:MAG: two-component system response regulator [Limisphaerales bacterium]
MKRCIYVVDDQAQVTQAAVRVVRSINPEWEVRGFTDPMEALAAVKAKAPDLILSDQMMPGMLGSQLFD